MADMTGSEKSYLQTNGTLYLIENSIYFDIKFMDAKNEIHDTQKNIFHKRILNFIKISEHFVAILKRSE